MFTESEERFSSRTKISRPTLVGVGREIACSEEWVTNPDFINRSLGAETQLLFDLEVFSCPGIHRLLGQPTLSDKQRVVSALSKSDSLRSTTTP